MSSSSWFQSMVVRGKKEYSNWFVCLGLTWYDLVLSVWCLSTIFVEMKFGKFVALMVLLLSGIGVKYWSWAMVAFYKHVCRARAWSSLRSPPLSSPECGGHT